MRVLRDFPDFSQESNGRIQLCRGQTELLPFDLAGVQLIPQGVENVGRQGDAEDRFLHLECCTKLLLWLTDGVDLGLLRGWRSCFRCRDRLRDNRLRNGGWA